MEKLSERLKKLRFEKKISINEVARRIGVSPSTYRTWENGAEVPESFALVHSGFSLTFR